ncbi:MAG: TrkA family potassium uptake protein [Victivallaceae bacterium]|jgi:trk system potassium uptake protein TrkA|nr:TrkA family potassium uptake protein [Victivallaceae bacterium]NLK83690.1 TrkA family potassium uptake protein [Lentisphaerota bacterium]MDD3117505.1 TrkA family potassium uptake protein [Victivallaceae bacterium]MDD3703538.1 TrkA family potassium uptake protein [Victivallaceae bacterium]MDD4317155.1 TrkA family potassium uptake protein [Victivallaceae bacterium]
MKGNYAVMGLGTFGMKLATELSNAGNYVVAIDVNPAPIDEIKDKVGTAIIADISNPDTIKELDVAKFNAVILSMSGHFEDQIIALTLLKQEGAMNVIAKANSPLQKRILLRLGANEVIQPDFDVAERYAKRLSMSNIGEMLDFKGGTIADVSAPPSMVGQSVRALDLRNRFNLTILLIHKPGEEGFTIWDPDIKLEEGDQLTVFGKEKDIIKAFNS